MTRTVKQNEIVAYPTESFYALGVKSTDPKAIRQLFHLKHRESGKPIALIAADLKQVKQFFFMSRAEERLAKKHWPGALTVLLRPKSKIAVRALLGLTTPGATPPSTRRGVNRRPRHGLIRIGVRVPAHAGARRLARQAGALITATSANISGQPPTRSAVKVRRDFPSILIVPGQCGKNLLPSTVVSSLAGRLQVLRAGAVKTQ